MQEIFPDPKTRIDILCKYLSSLMAEISELRTNTARIVIFVSGAIFAIAGWVISSNPPFSQRFLYLLAIISFLGVTLWMIKDLKRYFLNAAAVVKRIDNILQAHDEGVYGRLALLPEQWRNFGLESWKEPIFVHGRMLLLFSGLVSSIIMFIA